MNAIERPPPLATLMAADDGAALYLDIDGTLLDLRDDPEAVRADPPLIALLDQLSAHLGGALALVSGRDLSAVDRIFAPRRYTAAGIHGAQTRFPDESMVSFTGSANLPDVADTLTAACPPGLRVERKALSLALHYRGSPYLREIAEQLALGAVPLLGAGHHLKPGKDVVEILPAAANKGRAVELLATLAPFTGRQPIFIGDDVTDEQGFIAVNQTGGVSIRIGDPATITSARFILPDPAALRRWLAAGMNSQHNANGHKE